MPSRDPIELAKALASEVRWLRQQWLTQQLPDIDPFGGTQARADELVAELEEAEGSPDSARFAVFGAKLGATGDVHLAAQAVNRTARWGNRQLAAYPEIAEAAATQQAPAPAEWKDMLGDAKGAVAHALRHGEVPDKLKAAAMVVERVEGKVPQRVEVDAEGSLLETVFWRYVTALHLANGVPFEEAQRLAEASPETVQTWGRHVGLLPAGTVQDAEVVGG